MRVRTLHLDVDGRRVCLNWRIVAISERNQFVDDIEERLSHWVCLVTVCERPIDGLIVVVPNGWYIRVSVTFLKWWISRSIGPSHPKAYRPLLLGWWSDDIQPPKPLFCRGRRFRNRQAYNIKPLVGPLSNDLTAHSRIIWSAVFPGCESGYSTSGRCSI